MKRTVALLLVLVVLVGTMGCAKNYDDDYDGLWLCYALTDDNTTLSWHLGSNRWEGTNIVLSLTPENLYKYIRGDDYNRYGGLEFIIEYDEEKVCEENFLTLSESVFSLKEPGKKEYKVFSVKREKGEVVSIELDGLTYWRLSDEKVEEITTGKMSLSDFEKMFIK